MGAAVILGASGGIGGALLRRIAEADPDRPLVALSRRRPDDLPVQARWGQMDYADEESLAASARLVAEGEAPDLILVATGQLHGPGLSPEKSWRALDTDGLLAAFQANTIGPALAAKHLLPLLPRERPAVFAALSARVGSIADNQLGGWYGYRASKAALNQTIRTLAVELARQRPQAICVALHPGTVATDLSAPFRGGVAPERLFSAEESAAHLLRVVDGLTPADTGGFFAWDGTAIPW